MALWSLFVTVGDENFSTQVVADSPRGAIRCLLQTGGLKETLSRLGATGWPAKFSVKDIFVLIAIEDLVNMYLCQLGREGKYVSVVMARTVSRKYA